MRYISRVFFGIWVLLSLTGCVTTSGEVIPSVNYWDKKTIELAPEVFRVAGDTHPTVIVLHGSGGVDMHHRDWAKLINSWGYNAVVFDSFRPRGVRDVNGRAFEVPFLQRALDAEMVARWIKSQPWGGSKICVIGFSHGGVTVLSIDMDGDLNREIKKNHSFDCGVNYYGLPSPAMFFSKTTMPVQIHVGSDDGINNLSANKDFAKKYSSSTELFIYPNANHGFDRVATDIKVRGIKGLTVNGFYSIKSDPAAREESILRVKRFFDQHLN